MAADFKLSDIGKRIEARRLELELTKEAVQRGSKISPNTYGRLIQGDIRRTSLRTFQQIAEALKLPLSALVSEEYVPQADTDLRDKLDTITSMLKEKRQQLSPQPAKLQKVGVYGKVAAGLGAENEAATEEPEQKVEIPSQLLKLPGRKIGCIVSGDSMEPQLYAGDILVVWYGTQADVRERSRQGDIMVVTDSFNDEYVKRCYWDDDEGQLRMQSINPVYDDIVMDYASIRWTGLVVMTVRGDL